MRIQDLDPPTCAVRGFGLDFHHQALLRLEELIDGWTSRGEMVTDGLGRAMIRGYAGEYAVRAELDGVSVSIDAAIQERNHGVTTTMFRPAEPLEPSVAPRLVQ